MSQLNAEVEAAIPPWHQRLGRLFHHRKDMSSVGDTSETSSDGTIPKRLQRKQSLIKKLRTDMIRRIDDAPKLVNPSGWISEGHSAVPPHTPPATPVDEREDPPFLPLQSIIDGRGVPSPEEPRLQPTFKLPTVRERDEATDALRRPST
jgi:hypothetical protein